MNLLSEARFHARIFRICQRLIRQLHVSACSPAEFSPFRLLPLITREARNSENREVLFLASSARYSLFAFQSLSSAALMPSLSDAVSPKFRRSRQRACPTRMSCASPLSRSLWSYFCLADDFMLPLSGTLPFRVQLKKEARNRVQLRPKRGVLWAKLRVGSQ